MHIAYRDHMQAIETATDQANAACYPLTGQPEDCVITIQRPTAEALRMIASKLSTADREELAAAGHHDTLKAMVDAVATSREAYVACWDGEPQAIFGVNDFPSDPHHGIPWLLSAGTGHRHARQFMATARQIIDAWAPMYLSLRNVVSARHVAARRWLNALGFCEIDTHTIKGHRFVKLVRHV